MKRLLLCPIALCLFVGCSAPSPEPPASPLEIVVEDPAPWNHLEVNDRPEHFHFAVVGDRQGGNRPGVFMRAVEQLNLLQPAFVMSVGDLKASTEPWEKMPGILDPLEMPFFYTAGNSDLFDVSYPAQWGRHLGRTYYHFIYHDVLFIVLNSEDPPETQFGAFSDAQLAWLRETLEQSTAVRWTFVFLHRPMWLYEDPTPWPQVQALLSGRPHTVFGGHHHRYTKTMVEGQPYYGLATTGGSSRLEGVPEGRFDHITWVTMTEQGPRVANLLMEGIWGDDPAAEAMAARRDSIP